jgi:Transposase IS66 family
VTMTSTPAAISSGRQSPSEGCHFFRRQVTARFTGTSAVLSPVTVREGLVAAVIVKKYAWKPLFRQAQIMAIAGLPVDGSTARHSPAGFGAAAFEVRAVYPRLEEILLGWGRIAVDETRSPVLDPGHGPHQDQLLLGDRGRRPAVGRR